MGSKLFGTHVWTLVKTQNDAQIIFFFIRRSQHTPMWPFWVKFLFVHMQLDQMHIMNGGLSINISSANLAF